MMSNLSVLSNVLEYTNLPVLEGGMADNYEKIGELVREAREARGWSQEHVARLAGTNQQNVGRIESGGVKHSRFLQPVLAVLGLDVNKAVKLTAAPEDLIPGSLLVGDKGMPLYASTEGGDGALIVNFEPIDFLKWPAPLLHVPDGFGVLVSEESMVPAFEPGDVALVNPKLQPRKGKNCVLLGPSETQTVKSLIKRFESQTPGMWRVSQWNPREEFDLAKNDWPRCYAVVGKYDAR